MTLFDTYIVVDWSAAGKPCTGANSIWIALQSARGDQVVNPATRAQAMAMLRDLLAAEARAGRRVLAGFDFVFGYPAGLARAMELDDWRGVWRAIADRIADAPDNANNRFHAAGAINQAFFGGEGPFWGNGLKADVPGLPRRKPAGWGEGLPANRRACDARVPGAQEVWKLSGAGSVGGQALTGIAALERLRHETGATVWPFEAPGRGAVLAEVYPSLWPLVPAPGEVKDRAQVCGVASILMRMDCEGALARHLSARGRMPGAVLRHEAWMLGLAFE